LEAEASISENTSPGNAFETLREVHLRPEDAISDVILGAAKNLSRAIYGFFAAPRMTEPDYRTWSGAQNDRARLEQARRK